MNGFTGIKWDPDVFSNKGTKIVSNVLLQSRMFSKEVVIEAERIPAAALQLPSSWRWRDDLHISIFTSEYLIWKSPSSVTSHHLSLIDCLCFLLINTVRITEIFSRWSSQTVWCSRQFAIKWIYVLYRMGGKFPFFLKKLKLVVTKTDNESTQ